MTLFITGSTGFVGKNLIKALSAKYSIEIYNREESFNIKEDAVIHLAGKAHDLKNISNEAAYFEVNTEVTKNLFSSFIISTSKIFIYISSVKAIADTANQNALMETDIPNPLTPYGKSKLAAEQYLLSQPIPEGKKLYILRPCMIHGPENKGNLNLLFKLIRWGIPWPLGSFENKRSFFSIDNFCFVMDEILKGNLAPGVYNLADSEPLSTNQVIAILGKGLNKKPIIINVPKNLIKTMARVGDLFGLPLNSNGFKSSRKITLFLTKKLVNALGKDLPLTAQRGMLKTAISFTKKLVMIYLTVTAHPDDEILGFGGSAAILTSGGHYVYNLILSGEVEARRNKPDQELLKLNTIKAQEIIGAEVPILGHFPNIHFNTIPHLDLVQFIEKHIEDLSPDIIVTHHPYDLNNDHYHTSKACQAAVRLFQRKPIKPIKGLYFMEIPSSTDWAFPIDGQQFKADTFLVIGEQGLSKKIQALHAYEGVMRAYPHPRSNEAIRALAVYRGSQVGRNLCEAFQTAMNIIEP